MEPYILDETEDFAVVFKPPRMHCAPLRQRSGDTLLDWYSGLFPAIRKLSGWKEGEGGLLHRLDFETQGLVLFAKNQQSLDHLMRQQNEGRIIKEYTAICHPTPHSSFPPPPFDLTRGDLPQTPFVIESFFRPYGPGRIQVRPVVVAGRKEIASDKGGFYQTRIVSLSVEDDKYFFTVRLRRGFRHQIRCHLAWIGCPVLNDPVYGQRADGFLGLRATGLFFADSRSGEPREYRIAPLEKSANPM